LIQGDERVGIGFVDVDVGILGGSEREGMFALVREGGDGGDYDRCWCGMLDTFCFGIVGSLVVDF
jgi:hypothetical protein